MDCAVRTNLAACAAFLALGFVDVGNVVLVKSDCAEFAHVLATVSKTAAACVGHFVAAHRAFVAGNVNDFDYIGVGFVTAHCYFYTFGKNSTFLVNATTHCGYFARDNALRDVYCRFGKAIRPRFTSDFTQNFVLQMLNFCIEFSHCNFLYLRDLVFIL